MVQDEAELCFPQLINTSCRKPTTSPSHFSIMFSQSVLLFVISLLTVVLNLLVIISVSHFRQLHTPTNMLLVSLSVSDFLVGLLLMPGEILMKTSCWSLGDRACSLYNYMSFIITSASVGDMVLISLDRYIAVCNPLHYTTRVTVKRVQLWICLCWFCSALYCGFILKDNLAHPEKYNSCHGECVVFIDYTSGAVDLFVTFIFPLTIILILYVNVFVVVVSQARAIRFHVRSVQPEHSMTVSKKSELKAAKSLGVLVFVYLMCFCPYYSVSLAGNSSLSASFVTYVIYLFYFNSCLNPVLYAFFYPWFRKAVRHIVTLRILQPYSSESNIL